jgi:hypothetical protein
MYQTTAQPDKKEYFRKKAYLKWADYRAWYGKNKKYQDANQWAEHYIKNLNAKAQ